MLNKKVERGSSDREIFGKTLRGTVKREGGKKKSIAEISGRVLQSEKGRGKTRW